MEFFESVETQLEEQDLQAISIAHLPGYCASIDKVLEHQGDSGRIYCSWGEFVVHRELIRDGVRFTLPGCPNNLAWSITAGHEHGPRHVVIHLTISRQYHELDFIDSIHTFVSDWKQGIASQSTNAA